MPDPLLHITGRVTTKDFKVPRILPEPEVKETGEIEAKRDLSFTPSYDIYSRVFNCTLSSVKGHLRPGPGAAATAAGSSMLGGMRELTLIQNQPGLALAGCPSRDAGGDGHGPERIPAPEPCDLCLSRPARLRDRSVSRGVPAVSPRIPLSPVSPARPTLPIPGPALRRRRPSACAVLQPRGGQGGKEGREEGGQAGGKEGRKETRKKTSKGAGRVGQPEPGCWISRSGARPAAQGCSRGAALEGPAAGAG